MMKFNPVEYQNFAKCRECGGKCCKIYDNDDTGTRDKTVWFEEWCDGFHADRVNYGVEPLFDPLIVHMAGHEEEWKVLLSKGINPDYCQYLDLDGCRIPWEKRPIWCRTYKCDKITDKDIVLTHLQHGFRR